MYKEEKSILIIWENFQAGDKEAYAFLYNLYVEDLFRYGTKLCNDDDLVKDSIQDIFIDLYLKRKSNKSNPLNLKYYLILALKRDLVKKIHREKRLSDKGESEIIFETEYTIENSIIEEEEECQLNLNISKLLRGLTSKQKEALYLRFNQALSYPEIAGVMNISIDSARKKVYQALKKIREMFDDNSFIFLMFFIRS